MQTKSCQEVSKAEYRNYTVFITVTRIMQNCRASLLIWAFFFFFYRIIACKTNKIWRDITHLLLFVFGHKHKQKIDHHAAPGAQSYRNADLIITSLNLPQTHTRGSLRELVANKSKQPAELYLELRTKCPRGHVKSHLTKAGVSRQRPE